VDRDPPVAVLASLPHNVPLARAMSAVAAALWIAAARPVSAQEARPFSHPPEFALDQWTTADGLPQNSVNAIVEAPDGYLWIGTFGGLVRFDGTSFRSEARIDSSGHHIDRVLALGVGADSALWIGTEDGLLRYKNKVYQRYSTSDGLPDNQVTALHLDHAGVLWVGTQRGLGRLVASGRFEGLRAIGGVPLGQVTSLVEDAGGVLWVSAGDRFATVSNGSLASAHWQKPPVAGAQSLLLRDRRGTLWFSLAGGVARVDTGTTRVYHHVSGASGPVVIGEDPESGLWLGTNNDGLYSAQLGSGGGAATRYPLPDGRTNYRVRAVYVDGEGDTWFGTNASGLLRAKRNLFTTYTTASGLSHDVATAVYEDAEGTLWAATNCGGVNAISWSRQTVRLFKPRRPGDPRGDPCVFALTEAPAGTMWAGTWGGGLTRIIGGKEERLRLLPGLRDSVILALFTDRAGTVWVGTNNGGLAALRNGRVAAAYTTGNGLADNSVHAIYQTRDGALWIGTLKGMSRLADGRITTYRSAEGLSAEYVRAFHEDAGGDLWIGTYGGGLDRMHNGRITAITRRDGLADDVVSAILEDDQGYLWMSGNRGIFRVARSELEAFADGGVSRVHSVLYGPGDGMRKAETNGGFQPAAWKDTRGRLWFPTVEGLAMTDPARVHVMGRPPRVRIVEVVVNGASISPIDELEVGPGRSNLEFRYTGISLSDPQDVTFRYRLEGFDQEWVEAGTRRVAYYPGLRPGRYRFVVTAANRDGVWNEAGSSLRLRVLGPFWSTWWFGLGSAAGLVGLLLAAWWRRDARTRQARLAQEEFARLLIESQERERQRIGGELHDGLGQQLLVVRHRAQVALQGPDVSSRARDQLQQIAEVAAQTLETVRGLAHNLTPYQLDHLGLARALRAVAEDVVGTRGIRLEVFIDEIDELLPTESRINLYRIVQEALNNIVRHAGAASVTVDVRRMRDTLAVTIRDDGSGFQVRRDAGGRVTGGFGISGMAERARILHGRIELVSAPGQGTRIELFVPVPSVRQQGAASFDPGGGG
jgi:signal transduction histidine kinase/ligand-binding sensor domain-containing protein